MRSSQAILLTLLTIIVSALSIPVQAEGAVLNDLYGDPLPPGAITRMGTIRFHPGDQIKCLAFSPDGRLIASGNLGSTRNIVLWDSATGRMLSEIDWEGLPIRSVAFSPNGKTLAAGDQEGFVRIWDVGSGRELMKRQAGDGVVQSVAYPPNGTRLISGSRTTVFVWDVSKGEILMSLMGHGGIVTGVAYAPDGKTVASCSEDKTARIWDAETGRKLHEFEEQGPIYSIAFSPDGTAVAYGGWEQICSRNPASGKELWRKPGAPVALISLTFSPNSRTLALCGHYRPVQIWDAKTGEGLHELNGHRDRVRAVAFSPDGKTLASGSDDGSVRLWDTGSGLPITFGEGHETDVPSIAYSPDGKKLVSAGGGDLTLRLWDVETGKQLLKMQSHRNEVSCVAYSPDGRLLVSGSADDTIRLWDADSGREIQRMIGINSHLSFISFSPNGKTVAMAGGDEIGVWDVRTGERIRTLSGHTSYVFSAAFSPDGKTLVSGSQDETIRLWDVSSGRELWQIPAGDVFSVAYSPDGKIIAAGVSGAIHIYEADTRREMRRSENYYQSGHFPLAFSPDGKSVAAPFGLVEVKTGKTILPLKENNGRIASLAFSPDGKNLATGMTDSTVLVWDLARLRAEPGPVEKSKITVSDLDSPPLNAPAKTSELKTVKELMSFLRTQGLMVGFEWDLRDLPDISFAIPDQRDPAELLKRARATLERAGVKVKTVGDTAMFTTGEEVANDPMNAIIENLTLTNVYSSKALQMIAEAAHVTVLSFDWSLFPRGKPVTLTLHQVSVKDALFKIAALAGFSGWNANVEMGKNVVVVSVCWEGRSMRELTLEEKPVK